VKNVLKGFLVTALAFVVGLVAVRSIIERTSLEAISANVSAYEGKLVEFETYAQFASYSRSSIWLGQPFDKKEMDADVESRDDLSSLRNVLANDFSEKEYYRVKVIARGRVEDNCAHSTCCFGQSITLLDAEIVPIGPAERYRIPFDRPEH
jgi:hypothetical protein